MSCLSSALYTGITLAILSNFGKVPVWNDLLIIEAKMGDKIGSKSLSIETGYIEMWQDLFFSEKIANLTSCGVT